MLTVVNGPGLIPFAGDITDAFLNYFLVVRVARKADLPSWLVSKMMFNNAVSISVGLVPLVGQYSALHFYYPFSD